MPQPFCKLSYYWLNGPGLPNKGCQCIGKIIFLNMYELYSNGKSLVPPPNVMFQDESRCRSHCQCVGRDSIRPTVGGNAKHRGLSEAGNLDGNDPGHLSEDCNTALSLSQMLCIG